MIRFFYPNSAHSFKMCKELTVNFAKNLLSKNLSKNLLDKKKWQLI